MWHRHHENFFSGIINRILQLLALYAPSNSLRILLNRSRGVSIGKGSCIMCGTIIETSQPQRIRIGDRVNIGLRCIIMGHFRDRDNTVRESNLEGYSVKIGNDVYLGHSVIVLPGVTINDGAVVTAGSIVTRNIPSFTMAQGNPAKPIAKCGIALGLNTPYEDFIARLHPIRKNYLNISKKS